MINDLMLCANASKIPNNQTQGQGWVNNEFMGRSPPPPATQIF